MQLYNLYLALKSFLKIEIYIDRNKTNEKMGFFYVI